MCLAGAGAAAAAAVAAETVAAAAGVQEAWHVPAAEVEQRCRVAERILVRLQHVVLFQHRLHRWAA